MVSLFIVPVLLCGIIWIKLNPKQKAKISTYQGWIIYLYATFYGVVALSICWVFLEYVIPFLIRNGENVFDYLLIKTGIDIRINENYLDEFALYIIDKPPMSLPEEERYYSFIKARSGVISALAVVLTFAYSLLVFVFLNTENSKKKRVFKIYEHNSPIDYQLMLIRARMAERLGIENDLKRQVQDDIYINFKLKKLIRKMLNKSYVRSFLYFMYRSERVGFLKGSGVSKLNGKLKYLLDKSAERYFKKEILSFYLEVLNKQKRRIRKIKYKRHGDLLYAQITLDTNKVYVGIPKHIGLPDEKSIGNEEVSLFPLYSGYRDPNSMRLIITNEYELYQEDFSTDVNNVVIKKENIVSVSAFSMKYYKIMQEVKNVKFREKVSWKNFRRHRF